MKVLLAGSYLPDPRQGSPKVLLRLGAELCLLGHDVHFLFLDKLWQPARHHRLVWFLFPLAVTFKVLRANWSRRPFDVVDVSGGDGWLIATVKRCFRLKFVVICRSHGWEHEDLRIRIRGLEYPGRWKRGLMMRTIRLPMVATSAMRSDAIIVGSSPGLEFAVKRCWKPPQYINVVPCGVDPVFFQASLGDRCGGLLYVGSWIDRKGVGSLVRAYELVTREGCKVPLSIVGYGRRREEVLGAFDSSLRPNITIKETQRVCDERELASEYSKHNILAFPSLYEGFGMVFLEGMASGLAVVATPTGGVVDLIQDGENGVIVPVGDASALARAIIDLWNSTEKRLRLGRAARETARLASWNHVARQTVNCYHQVTVSELVGAGSINQ